MSNKIIIELQSKDNATGQIIGSVKTLETGLGNLERSGTASFAGLDKSIGGSVATLGKLAIAAGAASVAIAGMAFKEAIQGIEKFNQTTINIASQLTNMAAEGQGSFKEMFERNLAYAQGFYDKLRGFDAERASSIEEMMTVYNSLVTQGYAVRMDEAEALSKITDLIKQKTAGQNFEVQAMQEVRSLMDGQANANSRIAQELKSRLGPAWEDIVNKHRIAGTLLDYLNSLYPGIAASSEKMQQTLEAQSTTLKSQLIYIGREGLGGAYEDIVGLLDDINDYLKEHADTIIKDITKGWENIRSIISSLVPSIASMTETLIKTGTELSELAKNPFVLALLGAAAGSRLGVPGAIAGAAVGYGAAGTIRNDEEVSRGLERAKALSPNYADPTEIKPTKAQLEALGITASQTRVKQTDRQYPGMDKDFMERFIAMNAKFKDLTGETIKVTDSFRTFAQQADLYQRKPGLAARPGTSMHEKGLAMDIDSGQANKLAALGLLDTYGFNRPMLGGKGGKNEPWHIEMVDYKAQSKARTDGIKDAEKALKDYEKQQDKIRNLEMKHTQEAVKEASKLADETKKISEKSYEDYKKSVEDRRRLDTEANDWTIRALQESMQNESLTYDQRLTLGEQYKEKRLEQIQAEIDALRQTYGGRISEEALSAYQKSMTDQVDRQLKGLGDTGAFAWESAWKRAAENVQDALGDMIYNMVTQTKTGTDVLKSLFQGMTRMFSDLAAQAIMGQAKSWLGGGGGGGLFSGGGGGGIFGMLGGLFGGGSTGSYVGSSGFSLIDDMIGGMSFALAKGGILPGNFVPIQAFAGGGMVNRPTIGLVGEAGPEMIVPLNRAGGLGNYQISISHSPTYNYRPSKADIQRDARTYVEAMDKELRGYAKRTARNFVR